MCNTENNFNEFYNKYEGLDKDHIIKISINKLSINDKEYLNVLYDIVCNYLDNIKYEIVNKNILENISNISDIGDFRIIYYNENEQIFLKSEIGEHYEPEYLVYNIFYNDELNKYELNEGNLFETEIDEFLIILEDDYGNKIGYNKSGEFILILNSVTYTSTDLREYCDSFLYKQSTSLIDEFSLLTIKQYKEDHKIIELKNEEYWQPSSIIIISNNMPYTKETIDLTKYWNNSQSNNNYDISNIKITNENMNDIEICNINYVNGTADIISRSNDITYNVPFEYINENIKVSDDMVLGNESIVQLYNNLRNQ